MRYMAIGLAALLVAGCGGDGPTEPVDNFEGLRVKGTVRTPNGESIAGATISIEKQIGYEEVCTITGSLGGTYRECYAVEEYGRVLSTVETDTSGEYALQFRKNCDPDADYYITWVNPDWLDIVLTPDWRNPAYWRISVKAPGYVPAVVDNRIMPDRAGAECDSDKSIDFLLERDA